jgi:hypothetical protein
MNRRILTVFIILVVIASAATAGILLHTRLNGASTLAISIPTVGSRLFRTPHSAYKYQLCEEAFAYAIPDSQNSPYKTDDTFPDPFRHTTDTIVPSFLGFDWHSNSFRFTVKIEIGRLATYTDTIEHVQILDGISIILPDRNNKLQRSNVPQFIVSSIQDTTGSYMAILDYTCPNQWVWHSTST